MEQGTPEVIYKNAARVQPAERDHMLGLDCDDWPSVTLDGWECTENGLRRKIIGDDSILPTTIEESVLRFPSAPVHGLQRLHEHHAQLPTSEKFHTFRVIKSAHPEHADGKISRIFFMHTGLNERDTMGLYYRLASRLIAKDERTACIVRPFPGHLTRYPFQGLAETPLDLYLWDGSHLFRQFIRFMIETRWLLSALARRSSYRCASGANLIAEHDVIDESRLNPHVLARVMTAEWNRLRAASSETAEGELKEGEPGDGQPMRADVGEQFDNEAPILDTIRTVRNVLELDLHDAMDGELEAGEERDEPDMHVLGYSLGGFAAQSVFMAWPYRIASCSTVLAGGALKELAPTGFADPEEWQTVLHSLRYELDDRMMSKHLGVDKGSVAGIERDLFTYFKRTFYEVFQQEYHRSMETRYEAFGDRMLFIVGGNDPVVRPESVLRSGPKTGLNLLEVGGLSHFLQDPGKAKEGEPQQAFWLPEMASLMHSLADKAADELRVQRDLTWFDREMAEPRLSRPEWNLALARLQGRKPGLGVEEEDGKAVVRPLSPTELIAIEQDGALPGELFERCLDDLLVRVSRDEGGVLFVLRNEIPTVFLPPQAVRETAAALYHDDLSIARYCHGVEARRQVIEDHIDKICLVLPWNAQSIMRRMDFQRAYPSQAESAGGLVPHRPDHGQVWDKALSRCFELAERKKGRDSVRRFDGRAPFAPTNAHEENLCILLRDFASRHESAVQVSSLPDSWVWVSDGLLSAEGAKATVPSAVEDIVRTAASIEKSSEKMLRRIREEKVRIVAVSRARYNPRFRGRLVVDGKAARKRFQHAAACISMSEAIGARGEKIEFE